MNDPAHASKPLPRADPARGPQPGEAQREENRNRVEDDVSRMTSKREALLLELMRAALPTLERAATEEARANLVQAMENHRRHAPTGQGKRTDAKRLLDEARAAIEATTGGTT